MAFKFIVLLACAALSSAAVLYDAPALPAEPESHPSYSFNYDVQDAETGDFKSQSETRNGDVVQGQYTLQDADGYQRIVEYSVNGESGFNAVVRREPLPGKALPLVAAPVQEQKKQAVLKQTFVQPAILKAYTHPTATFVKTYSHGPAVLHHATPTHIIHHAQPAVHLAPTAHIVHAAPAGTTLSHPALITTHHQAAGGAVVRTSFAAPHVQYVY